MLLLSSDLGSLLQNFAPLFDARVWSYAQLLLVGAILAPGKRTVTSVLRIMGLSSEKRFQNYHRVLNRAHWNSRTASQILLGLLIRTFAPSGPILVGLDDTIERRWGKKIQARGIYRDPVRSSRWFSLCENERPALVEPDAAGRDSLGGSRMGFAVPDRPGSFETL
jgi:DDE superfamily endonuclease